jgi:hypothetical protein
VSFPCKRKSMYLYSVIPANAGICFSLNVISDAVRNLIHLMLDVLRSPSELTVASLPQNDSH